ncbi:MAG TPA: hypothetical protein VFX33_11760 [Actinomycetales bacterium]|nr:hypothetical protein [Actinomycetales bacterium]
MKDHYWDFRVGRWLRYVPPPTPAELVPSQRIVEEAVPTEAVSTTQVRPVTPAP